MDQNQPLSGEAELEEVVRTCETSEKCLFIVGPSRSGKSTRLPVLFAARISASSRILSVQPDDWAAQYHSEWINSSREAGTYDGRYPTVGWYPDDFEIPYDFVPQYNVSFVSYRWFYRLVVGVDAQDNATKFTAQFNQEAHNEKIAERQRKLQTRRSQVGHLVRYVILDEFHSQSLNQELGYMALHAVMSKLVDSPVGITEKTKSIITTAYPTNRVFLNCFELSADQVQLQTININRGISPNPAETVVEERFLEKKPNVEKDYHSLAVEKVLLVLRINKKARVLVFVDTRHSRRNIIAYNRQIRERARLVDLDTAAGRNLKAINDTEPVVIIVTPTFGSRIPVAGITDIVAPRLQLLPTLDHDLHREVLADIRLARWQVDWMKKHLDPSCNKSVMHYMFDRDILSTHQEEYRPRWPSSDLTDLFLGLIRLCPQSALNRYRTPQRLTTKRETSERAFAKIASDPFLILPAKVEDSEPAPYYTISDAPYMPLLLELTDRCGLGRDQAMFLGILDMGEVSRKNRILRFIKVVGVCMIVFGDYPILRRQNSKLDEHAAINAFMDCYKGVLYFGMDHNYASDSWANAVVWLSLQKLAASDLVEHATGSTEERLTNLAREISRSAGLTMNMGPIHAAADRLKLLAHHFGLDEETQAKLCDGSFLDDIHEFITVMNNDKIDAIHDLWAAYLDAFKYNMVYIRRRDNRVTIQDVATGKELSHESVLNVVDLFDEAIEEDENGGFFAIASVQVKQLVRNMTIMPASVLWKLTGKHGEKGNLSMHLSML